MYYREHNPLHFHAQYGEKEMRVNIQTGEVMSGDFSHRAERLVLEWCNLHRDESLENWNLALERKPFNEN